MSDIPGTGFAKLVTIETLDKFAPLLRRISSARQSAARATGQEETGAEEPQQPANRDPDFEMAEKMFAGTYVSVKLPFRRKKMAGGSGGGSAGPVAPPAPPAPPVPPVVVAGGYELLWRSKPLTRRDLGIPEADGTNATGSINLDKGLLPADTDHRHYFREQVFSHLDWMESSDGVDEAYASFELVIDGINHGQFDSRIGHTTSTTSTSYLRKNAMTRLSWGLMKRHIANPDFIGGEVRLSRNTANPTQFRLELISPAAGT